MLQRENYVLKRNFKILLSINSLFIVFEISFSIKVKILIQLYKNE